MVAESPELQAEIDDLALTLVIEESHGPAAGLQYLAAIERIRESAARLGNSSVSSAATELIQTLQSSPNSAAVLADGIAGMQRALEGAGTSNCAAPSVLSPAADPE